MKQEPVQMVWVGSQLGRFDILAMKSFLANGHPVHLYVYEKISNVPPGVTVLDGNEVISKKKIFLHENSYAAFADLFRWALLAKKGGIYSDTDVICLKPLNLSWDNYLGYEFAQEIITPTIMRFNKGHQVVLEMLDCALHPTRKKAYDTPSLAAEKSYARRHFWKKYPAFGWGETAGPNGLTRLLNYWQEQGKALDLKLLDPEVLYPIYFNELDRLIKPSEENIEIMAQKSYTVHLWNEVWRRNNIDKNQVFPANSVLGQLINKYE